MASINDIGIDLGTSRVLIYMKEKGIVLNEAAVVVVNRDTQNILAIGDEAARMVGRTPGNILAIRPLRDGAISDFDLVSFMLKGFLSKTIGKHMFARPRAILAVPTNVNEVERRSLISVMFDAGMRRTQLLNRSLAAALGAGLDIDEGYGTMLVDISAGVTDIAVISYGKVLVNDCINVGGDRFDDAIIRHLRRKHNLFIGERTAEALKIDIGSAIPRSVQTYREVTGRNLITGLPKTMRISSDDITEAIDDPLQQLIEGIHGVLEHTPAELAADIFEYGILLSGGGAKLFGLCEAIAEALKVPCTVAEDPQNNVVIGCGRALENMSDLGKFLDDGRKRMLGRG